MLTFILDSFGFRHLLRVMLEDVQWSHSFRADICLFYTGSRASLCFFLFLFFNDRCCVSATRGARYVSFPAVSAAVEEAAAATGIRIITGNSV